MDIVLYKNSSPNNYLEKSLTDAVTLKGAFRADSSIVDPVLDVVIDNPSHYNYLYIPEFSRFYYINNIDTVKNHLWKIICHVDVLNTYRAQILSHQAIINKQASDTKSDLYLDDGDFVVKNKKSVEIERFPNGLNEEQKFILITAGA